MTSKSTTYPKMDLGDAGQRSKDRAFYLSSLIDNISDALISTDLDFRIREWNAACERMYGWMAAEVTGHSLGEFIQIEYTDTTREQALKTVLEKGTWNGEVTQNRRDGSRFPVMSSVSQVKDEAGQLVGFVAINRDITDHRHVEEKIAWLASFPEMNPNPVVEIAITGAVSYMNLAAQRKFPDLEERGFDHPWLAGLEAVIAQLRKDNVREAGREIQFGEEWYSQPLYYLPETGRLRVYAAEITERKQAEQQAFQMKRLYATLSQVNQAILRIKERQEFFQAICDVAVKFGEFSFAWIGLLDETSGEVHPAAAYGLDLAKEILPVVNIQSGVHAKGPIAQAIRTWQVITSENMQSNPQIEKGRSQFQKRGWPSAAVIPFRSKRQTIGVLNLVSQEKFLFRSENEVLLLDEMGLDISFALDMMENAEEHRRSADEKRLITERYALIFNTVREGFAHYQGIYENDRLVDLRVLEINESGAEQSGVARNQQVGRTWREVWPDVDENLFAIYQQVDETGELMRFDHDNTLTGRSYDVQISRVAKAEFVVSFNDVTERVRAERALRENEERLRLSLQAADQGLYDLNVQTGAAVVNREYAQMLGYDPETFVETNAAWIERLHPEDRESVAKAYSDYVSGLLPEYRIEFRQRMKDGNWKWILSLGKVIEYDTEGKPLRMLGTHTDITKRKQAEDEIRSRSHQLAVLLEASQSLIESLNLSDVLQKVTDKGAEILASEATAIYLVEGDDLYLGSCSPALPAEFPDALRRASLADHPHIAEALATGQIVTLPDAATASLTAAEQTVSASLGLRTVLYIPSITRKDAVGILLVGSVGKPREFSNDEKDLANALSNQAALAITNAKLYEDLARYVEELENQIRERIQAQQALTKSEERFRLLFEKNHAIMMLVDPVSGVIRNANAAAESFYGYPLAKLCGMNISEINGLSPEETHAERMRALREERNFFKFQHRLASGEIRSVEVHSAPLEVDGNTLLFSMIYDMTDYRRAEEKLSRHVNYLIGLREIDQAIASSFDSRLSLSILASRAVPLLKADAASVLTLDPVTNLLENVAGHGFRTSILHTDSVRLSESYAGKAVMERQMVHISNLAFESHNWFPRSFLTEENFVSYYGVPLIMKGKVLGVLEVFNRTASERDQEWLDFLNSLASLAAIAIDNARLWDQVQRHARELELRVAERTAALNRTNIELEHANQTKDEFLANMSHELRTPLNSILGLSESLIEQRRDPLTSRQQRSLEIIASSGHHLLELINDVLDLSKIEAGKFDYYPQHVDVEALCRSCLSFVKNQASRKSITITYQRQDSLTNMVADPRRLKQILVNLLTNAVKFTPERGWVRLEVTCSPEKNLVRFSVEDNGIGIDLKDLKRLFKPFVQVDSKLNRQFEGTGLGLSLVEKLTDLHGGSVEVTSEVGVGSRFTVNLPWRQPGEVQEATIPSQMSRSDRQDVLSQAALKGISVLLAEDNMANILTISEYLESYGCTVVSAHDGLEAIEKAIVSNPNMILMDIQMPAMDGLEAIHRLRGNPRFASTPIIAITALAMPGDRERCLEAGANEYMSKPISLSKLRETILKLTAPQTKDT